jgi:hypothetical protein
MPTARWVGSRAKQPATLRLWRIAVKETGKSHLSASAMAPGFINVEVRVPAPE